MAIDLAVYTSHVLPGCNECNSGDAYNLSDHVFDVPNNVTAIKLIHGVYLEVIQPFTAFITF